MMGDMGGLRAIVNAGEKVRTGQFLIFLHIALVHIDRSMLYASVGTKVGSFSWHRLQLELIL